METSQLPSTQRLATLRHGGVSTHHVISPNSSSGTPMFTTLYKSIPARSPQIDPYSKIYTPRASPHVIGGGTIKVSGRVPSSSATSASQFAYRFKAQHHVSSTPHIIGINTQANLPRNKKRFNGFFPPVKLRSADSRNKELPIQDAQYDHSLTLEPVNDGDVATESESRPLDTNRTATTTELQPSMPAAGMQTHAGSLQGSTAQQQRRAFSTSSQQSQNSSGVPQGSDQNQVVHKYMFSTPIYPRLLSGTQTCNDLTYLPKPRGVYPAGDLPWVYRHKVKRSMNELSKIMSSKVVVADTQEYQLPF